MLGTTLNGVGSQRHFLRFAHAETPRLQEQFLEVGPLKVTRPSLSAHRSDQAREPFGILVTQSPSMRWRPHCLAKIEGNVEGVEAQTRRLPIISGVGIDQTSTISSNFLALTLIQTAASVRPSPRGVCNAIRPNPLEGRAQLPKPSFDTKGRFYRDLPTCDV